MNTFSILLQKMRTEAHSPVQYYLSLGEEELFVNELLNQNISLHSQVTNALTVESPKKFTDRGSAKNASLKRLK